MASVAGGLVCGELLDMVLGNAYPTWDDMEPLAAPGADDAAGGPDDMRLLNRRKVWRAKLHVRGQSERLSWVLAAWVAEPIDRLWSKLQWADNRGGLLMRLVRRDSPILQCQAMLAERLQGGTRGGAFLSLCGRHSLREDIDRLNDEVCNI